MNYLLTKMNFPCLFRSSTASYKILYFYFINLYSHNQNLNITSTFVNENENFLYRQNVIFYNFYKKIKIICKTFFFSASLKKISFNFVNFKCLKL